MADPDPVDHPAAQRGAVALKVGRLPAGATPRYVVGAAALGGIGFTVSLFVTELAFGEEAIGTDARLGRLIGALVAVLLGTAIMMPGSVADDHSMDEHATSNSGLPAETTTKLMKID